jgi:hypothetical protein
MVVRKKNLLDAFREAAPEGRKASEFSQPTSSSVGGPFAAPHRKAAEPSAPERDDPRTSPEAERPIPPKYASAPTKLVTPRGPTRPPTVEEEGEFDAPKIPSTLEQALADKTLRAVVAVVALIALGAFLAGRMSADPTQAADSGSAATTSSGPGLIERRQGTSPSTGKNLAEKNLAAAKMGTEDDRAFMDPANKYTIRLIQYDNTEANLERAQATAEHLRRKEALPVVGPISMGKILVLTAGHSPKIADLGSLLKHVRGLHGPPPQDKGLPFADAYVVNIDDVVKRD